jgi:broad specificity phosphatase PhoE
VPTWLVRHAKAGSRHGFVGDDRQRPLTPKGRAQALRLAEMLAPSGPRRVLSSPARRCVETVEPLACRLGVPVEVDEALAEGACDAAVQLVRSVLGEGAVLSTHGDVLPAVLERFAAEDGIELPRPLPVEKGSAWVLEEASGRVVAARYLGPAPDR